MSETTVSSYRISLPATLTLAQLQSLQQECLQHCTVQRLEIDAAAVEHIDTAALQLLLAVHQENPIYWENPSLALCAAAQTLSLTFLLKLPNIAL